ncbi:DNA gyrase C-terminal beta-propeller domain-containing protein, partial [Brevibacillus sp. SIMBA_076]|uniref:DNA gyrase C-terminal beta-propeller domain-containing protein n=1 Tax=Brevibacillus sp. SIMBA_076 TaxID=3085814 RepID=UPI00397A6CA3
MTKDGMVKRTPLRDYDAQRKSKPLMALKLKGDDEVVFAGISDGPGQLFLVSERGYGLWFKEDDVPVVGQRAAGVK